MLAGKSTGDPTVLLMTLQCISYDIGPVWGTIDCAQLLDCQSGSCLPNSSTSDPRSIVDTNLLVWPCSYYILKSAKYILPHGIQEITLMSHGRCIENVNVVLYVTNKAINRYTLQYVGSGVIFSSCFSLSFYFLRYEKW